MTPKERAQFEIDIYNEIHKPENNGCISDAADYMRLKDSTRISRICNPNDSRANNVFGEMSDLLEAFYHKYPQLEEYIWEKLALRRNSYRKQDAERETMLTDLVETTIREQLDVNCALYRRASQDELEAEAFQALERSKTQYEQIVALRNKTQVVSEKVQ